MIDFDVDLREDCRVFLNHVALPAAASLAAERVRRSESARVNFAGWLTWRRADSGCRADFRVTVADPAAAHAIRWALPCELT